MQSFKQFLKEDKSFYGTAYIDFKYYYSGKITGDRVAYAKALTKQLGANVEVFWTGPPANHCTINFTVERSLTEADIVKLRRDIRAFIEIKMLKSGEMGQDAPPFVYCEGFPPAGVHIQYTSISVNLDAEEYDKPAFRVTSLSGIDKQIDCKILTLQGSYAVTKNVLSLLKIKGLKVLRYDQSDLDDDWAGIVAKHASTHDILGCQEELIENGFKEFAKL